MEKKISMDDRYSAIGVPMPGREEICKGQCEGVGVVPIHRNETDHVFKKLWLKAENKQKSSDGYHFVKCPACGGTGVRKSASKNKSTKNK